MTTWQPVKRSSMHDKHLAHGAAMVERDGWQQPACYATIDTEMRYLKETVGILDISPACKLVLKGEDLGRMLSVAFPVADDLETGDVRLAALANVSSPASIILARLASDEILALASAGLADVLAANLAEDPGGCAHVIDLSSGLAGVGIAGPRANLILEAITELDTLAPSFPNMRCAQSKFADIQGILLRTDQAGLPGYQLYFGREFGEYMWDVLMEAARRYDGAPVGFQAMEGLSE